MLRKAPKLSIFLISFLLFAFLFQYRERIFAQACFSVDKYCTNPVLQRKDNSGKVVGCNLGSDDPWVVKRRTVLPPEGKRVYVYYDFKTGVITTKKWQPGTGKPFENSREPLYIPMTCLPDYGEERITQFRASYEDLNCTSKMYSSFLCFEAPDDVSGGVKRVCFDQNATGISGDVRTCAFIEVDVNYDRNISVPQLTKKGGVNWTPPVSFQGSCKGCGGGYIGTGCNNDAQCNSTPTICYSTNYQLEITVPDTWRFESWQSNFSAGEGSSDYPQCKIYEMVEFELGAEPVDSGTFCGDTVIQHPNDQGIDEICDDGMHCANGISCTEGTECTDGSVCQPRSGDGCGEDCQYEGNLPMGRINISPHTNPDQFGNRTVYIRKGTNQRFQAIAEEQIPADQEYLWVFWRELDGDWNQIGGNWSCVDDPNESICTHDFIYHQFNDSGTYQMAIQVFDKVAPDGLKCNGKPGCGDGSYGNLTYCSGWFDCDPYHTGPTTNDEDLLTVVVTECGDTILDVGEECEKGGIYPFEDVSYDYEGANLRCHPGTCTLYTASYCGDGTKDLPESCDEGDQNGVLGSGCDEFCELVAEPWFRTDWGDVYSADGVSQTMKENEKLTRYLCLRSGGTGYSLLPGVCVLYSKFDLSSDLLLGNSIKSETENALVKVFARLDDTDYVSPAGIVIRRNNSEVVNLLQDSGLSGREIWYYPNAHTVNIRPDRKFNSGLAENEVGRIYITHGDFNVENVPSEGATIQGFFITDGEFKVAEESGSGTLTIDGGIIVLGSESSVGVTLNRTLGLENSNNPAEEIIYDPRYIDMFRQVFGEIGEVQFVESGVQ